jgi:polyisoprenoid-binding protein YceI
MITIRNKMFIITFVFLTLFQNSFTLFATGFNLNVSGAKKFELNENVGQPQLLFLSNAPLEDIKGSVNQSNISSTFTLEPNNIEKTTGFIAFEVKGMQTGIKTRDGHLIGKDWLDGESYPYITFNLQKVTDVKVLNSDQNLGKSVATAIAVGEIYIHGKSKKLNIPINITFIRESDESKKRAKGDFILVNGKFDITLKDFNITGKGGVIGSKVGEVIKIELNLFYSSK